MMHRRDFLTLGSMTGLSLLLPGRAGADSTPWAGPYFLHMHAEGGWDSTMFCDGKLASADYDNRLVTGVEAVGGVPVPASTSSGKFLLRRQGEAFEDPLHFFQTLGQKVRVFNGLDTQTNNHSTGVQSAGCGHSDIELPCISALYAGKISKGRDVPMAFLGAGPYNRTADVVAVSRFPGDKIPKIAHPYKPDGPTSRGLLSDFAVSRMQLLRAERMSALSGQATLPRTKRSLEAMEASVRSGNALGILDKVMTEPSPSFASFEGQLPPEVRAHLGQVVSGSGATAVSRYVQHCRPMEQILRCFKHGLSASATYSEGGFDTHSNHDVAQQEAMASFVARLRYVLLRAEQMGIADKLYVLVTSDFGRTPKYNADNGRDHWNVTSALVVAPGVAGGRAIGRSDAALKAMRVSKSNVATSLPDTDTAGARIRPSHLHRELRRALQIEEISKPFTLPSGAGEEPLALLG